MIEYIGSLLELGFLIHWPNMTRAHFDLQKSLQTAEIHFFLALTHKQREGYPHCLSVARNFRVQQLFCLYHLNT